jgi:hypothetical protein
VNWAGDIITILGQAHRDVEDARGSTELDAIRGAIEGKPWLPPPPALA